MRSHTEIALQEVKEVVIWVDLELDLGGDDGLIFGAMGGDF